MKRLLPALAVLFLLATPASGQDFTKGLEAYERGDYVTALKEWRPLAEQGYTNAQFFLGLMYYAGHGVPVNDAQAMKWYRNAAEQGHARAQFNLGSMYDRGHGVLQDYAQAVKWYRKAAEQGNFNAQLYLGKKYYSGHGVTQDYVQAHKWYNLAAAQGDTEAKRLRDDLARLMTTAQIDKAQRLAREWAEKHWE